VKLEKAAMKKEKGRQRVFAAREVCAARTAAHD